MEQSLALRTYISNLGTYSLPSRLAILLTLIQPFSISLCPPRFSVQIAVNDSQHFPPSVNRDCPRFSQPRITTTSRTEPVRSSHQSLPGSGQVAKLASLAVSTKSTRRSSDRTMRPPTNVRVCLTRRRCGFLESDDGSGRSSWSLTENLFISNAAFWPKFSIRTYVGR